MWMKRKCWKKTGKEVVPWWTSKWLAERDCGQDILEKWSDLVGIAVVCIIKGSQGSQSSHTEKPQEINTSVASGGEEH